MTSWFRSRLATRLGVTHGALVVLLVALLVVTLQGLVRMLGVMSVIGDEQLSAVEAEEEIHRSAWSIELELRHGRLECDEGTPEEEVRAGIAAAKAKFAEVISRRGPTASPRFRTVAMRYDAFAEEAMKTLTCSFLALPSTDHRRSVLDEDMTDVWIERLQELHNDIESKERLARGIGERTAVAGVVVAVLGAITAVLVARSTARSITRPIRRLAADATRLGDGDFTPIEPVDGPTEIEDLRRDLERTREKLLDLEKMKHAFLASVSHELRTPLGRLREAIGLLADGTTGELTPQQMRVLTLAGRACEHEVRIVESLLDMSRISSGKPLQRESGADLGLAIEAAIRGEHDLATERGTSVELVTQGKPPPMTIDSALVERSIANLVRNAISVSKKVRVVLSVDPDWACVDVVDDGPGVNQALVARVFEPFAAAAVDSVGRPAGIGLGLSMSRAVARAHGGDLVHIAAEASTTFRLKLPLPEKES